MGKHDEIEKKAMDIIMALWPKYDTNKTGSLAVEQCLPLLNQVLPNFGLKFPLTIDQVREMMTRIDKNDDNRATKIELLFFVTAFVEFGEINEIKNMNVNNPNPGLQPSPQFQQDQVFNNQLKGLIDSIWPKYDKDNSLTLDVSELPGFMNEALQIMGLPQRVGPGEGDKALAFIDKNGNQKVEKMEVFMVLKQFAGK